MVSIKKLKYSWRRFAYLLLWSIFTAILVVACSATNDVSSDKQLAKDCRVVQHTMGEICIPQNPQRVVTLTTDYLANSLALGIEPIASAFVEGFPLSEVIQNQKELIESVGDINKPSLEKIALLDPDLIISNAGFENIYSQLSQIAPTVVFKQPYPDVSWKEQLKELARVFGKEEAYQQLMADYRQRIEQLKQKLGEQNLEISVAGIASGAGIWTYGAKQPVGEILNDLGLQRPPVQRGNFYFLEHISEEKLSDIDGDVLFLTCWGRDIDREMRDKLRQKPLWQKLKAVKQQQVYVVDTYWHNEANIFAINAILDDLEKYLVKA